MGAEAVTGASHIIVGDAWPLVEGARQRVIDAAAPHIGPPAFNHTRHLTAEGPDGIVAARTLPMMAALRLVEIRHIEEGDRAFFDALYAYLAAPSESTVLVASGAGLPKGEAPRMKAATKGRATYSTLDAKDMQPLRFVEEAAGRHGVRFAGGAAARLVVAIGADLGQLEQEVEKLSLYAGGDTIRVEHVEEASVLLADAVIWDLTTGIAARDAGIALPALQRLQASGHDPHELLAKVVWQMRTVLRAVEMMDAGANDGAIAGELRMRRDVLGPLRRQHRGGSLPSAPALLRRLATLNRDMHGHKADGGRLLEGVVLELLDGRLRRPPNVPR